MVAVDRHPRQAARRIQHGLAGALAVLTGACGGRSSLAETILYVEVDSGPAGASDASFDASSMDASSPAGPVTLTTPDCPGCTFPQVATSTCTGAPPIKLLYPPDGALLPPNLNVLSVQWTPYGAPFARFEVDITESAKTPTTDVRIITACSAQTLNMQPGPAGTASGGCEVVVDPSTFAMVATNNKGGAPVTIAVRGTTDGACASTSTASVQVSFAEQDVQGTFFYWKSNTTALGTGGQVWAKSFGDVATPEQNVTSTPFHNVLCAGCHTLARDRSRMLVYAVDDTDADYGGLGGSYLDMTPLPSASARLLAGAWIDGGAVGGQPPGWSTIAPNDSRYLTSNGVPCLVAGQPCQESTGYPSLIAANAFSVWQGQTGAFVGAAPVTASAGRPTMPDWSADGTSLVYVVPGAVASWDNGTQMNDDHIFGGSLLAAPSQGGAVFGAASTLVASQGENNYYPSYSPDAPPSLVAFDRVALDTSVPEVSGCRGTPPAGVCPNDSFANPAARLMLVSTRPGSTPVDLQKANGSLLGWSNSYPRFLPFVQSYKGGKVMWISFSSIRDYGLRVINQASTLHPCYPPDSPEWPGSTHHSTFSAQCQQPQLWLAPIFLDAAGNPVGGDPSGPALWIPYQDPTTHNHLAQWTK